MTDAFEHPQSTMFRERIDSERAYHEGYYRTKQVPLAVTFDLADSVKRRPHNLTWAFYDAIREHFRHDLGGKKILEIGCGTGTVALNLARNGAIVDACDVSEQAVSLSLQRAAYNNVPRVNFFVSAIEDVDLQDNYYDAVVGHMVLHHIDIPTAMEKVYRNLKPGGVGVFAEWKEYAVVDRVRSIALLRWLFRRGGVSGYATEYERKLSASDFANIRERFPGMTLDYRYCMRGKIEYFNPTLAAKVERVDYLTVKLLPFLNRFTDGVVLCVRK